MFSSFKVATVRDATASSRRKGVEGGMVDGTFSSADAET
jgi:hypothetical protein